NALARSVPWSVPFVDADHILPAPGGPASKAVRNLYAHNVGVGGIVAAHRAFRGLVGIVVDGGVADEQVRVADINRGALIVVVLGADRDPIAIVVWQGCGAIPAAVHRRLIPGHAAFERPLMVQLIVGAQGHTPGIAKAKI